MNRRQLNMMLALVLALVLSVGLLPVRASAATVTFTDVPASAWYYSDVTRLAGAGVLEGVGGGKFAPDREISNAEMVKLIVNAFFGSEYEAYEAANYGTMNSYFSGNMYWFSFRCYFAKQKGLLDGTDVNIDSYASCTAPMSRYDMAMLLSNAAKAKGITATAEQKAAAQAGIADYSSIPAKYQDAVKTCFALKTKNASGESKSLIEGSNGRFNGTANMTRAQACAVIVRLENLIINGGSTTEPTTPAPTTDKEIKVSSEYWSGSINGNAISGNAWTVTDNNFGDGYLNNGKPITEENVLELLRQAEAIWTKDTKWSDEGSGNNFYKDSGSIVSAMMKTPNTGAANNLNSNFACGGYAAMISDYIFGRDNNNFHLVSDVSKIRPGDIVIEVDKSTNKIRHAMVAVSTSGGAYTSTEGWTTTSTRAGYVHFTDGNNGGKVCWPTEYSAPIGYVGNRATNYTWLIYSRYPNSGTSGTPTTPVNGKEIKVSSEFWSGKATDAAGHSTDISGNAWTVTDNGFGNGYLNNGKPITEENVLELLRQAEGIWTQDTKWSTSGSGNNFYKSSGSVVSAMLKRQNTGATTNIGSNFGCGGYAAMISDYIFGRDNNNFHKVSDFSQIRPGDILIWTDKSTNEPLHVMVAVSTSGGAYTSKDGWTTTSTRAGYAHLTDGNNSDKIKWPTEYSAPTGYVGRMAETYNWLIYSRYPT